MLLQWTTKNVRKVKLYCPCTYISKYKEAFLNDPHYEVTGDLTEQQRVNERLAVLYKQNKWQSIGNFSAGRLGVGYVLPKHAKPDRVRPIVPGCLSCLRAVYSKAARGLRSLRELNVVRSFDIDNVAGLIKVAKEASVQGVKFALGFDVKQLFTELTHADVREALAEFLQKVKDAGVKYVFVEKRGRGSQIRQPKDPGRWTRLSLKQIYDVVCCELEHMFFRCGTVILKQTVGLAMGGYGSPILACLVLSMAESKVIRSLQGTLYGARFVDDMTLFSTVEFAEVGKKLTELLNVYPSSLDLELEYAGNEVCMLESVLNVDEGTVKIAHRNKNEKQLCKGEALSLKKGIHVFSGHDRNVKKAVLLGQVLRISQNTDGGTGLIKNLLLMLVEAIELGYKIGQILTIMRRATKYGVNECLPQAVAVVEKMCTQAVDLVFGGWECYREGW